jgi:putative aldouronate transport system substrate-binding protein
LTSVVEETLPTLSTGAVDPAEALPELNERLEAAGVDRFLEEVQRQVDAYLGNQDVAQAN